MINIATPLIRDILVNVPLFRELTYEELEKVVEIAQLRIVKQKMLVFMQDHPMDRVFFIQSGKVKIYKTDINGKEQIVSVLEDGEMFPHAVFFRKGEYPAHAEIMADATLVVIPIKDLEEILIRYPSLCLKLLNVLSDKIIDLQNRLQEQILHNTYEQIIMMFLRLCRTNGIKENDKYKLTTRFTNKEMANMIGTTRETISRTISHLKKKNIMEVEDGFFIIDHIKLHDELN